jgi:transcriptional regulator with XRE-family HTH domain
MDRNGLDPSTINSRTRIKKRLKEINLTANKIAEITGYSVGAVSAALMGRSKSRLLREAICSALVLPLEEVWPEETYRSELWNKQLRDLHKSGKTLTEIAEIVGKSRQYVAQALNANPVTASRIRMVLRSRRISARDIAEDLGVLRTAVENVISGYSRNKKIQLRLADIVGCPVDELWEPLCRRTGKPNWGRRKALLERVSMLETENRLLKDKLRRIVKILNGTSMISTDIVPNKETMHNVKV